MVSASYFFFFLRLFEGPSFRCTVAADREGGVPTITVSSWNREVEFDDDRNVAVTDIQTPDAGKAVEGE